MAQVIPPITSLPLDSSAAPSVEDIQDRLPSICVDYLSHDWSEEDVWASWRNMTRHKHEIANGVRLENASWRTWQKQRNKLKTISPETLNWLKDSDVTWLYGPLHTASVEPVRPLRIAPTDDRLGLDRPNPKVAAATKAKKPILKHRTLSEMLSIPMPSSPILEHTGSDGEGFDGSDDDGDRPQIFQTKSDTNILRARGVMPPRRHSPPRHHNLGRTPTEDPGPLSPTDSQTNAGKKHISFNTFVEQCVAVDDPTHNQQQQQDIQSDSEDEMLEMKPSSFSSSSRSSRPSISRQTSSSSSDHITIAKIAPTMLKIGTGNNPNLQMVYAPPLEYQSPEYENSNSYDFPSPQVDPTTGKWHQEDEDEHGNASYDYFGGPNLAAPQSAPIYTQGSSPSQQKWRPASSPQGVEPSSVSSNSSASSYNVISPPQPSRGILKVRPAGQQSPRPEPSSPPLAYFDYNPSAATGIGGMRGSTAGYEYGSTGSPVTSPAPGPEERGRGRTPSRERLNDRSTSRGTSSSSMSSSSSKSPTESSSTTTPRKVQTPPQLDRVQEESHQIEQIESVGPEEGAQGAQVSSNDLPSPNSAAFKGKNERSKDYVPDRSSTPTPHSSPQISFRPLKDTSPASLPHTSTSTRPSDLPKADPPTSVPPTSRSTSGARATIAHVGTNAQPTLSQPVDDEDGASIMGRAANIASSAKDLLGALWYGANEGQATGQQGYPGQGLGQRQDGGGAEDGKSMRRRSGSS